MCEFRVSSTGTRILSLSAPIHWQREFPRRELSTAVVAEVRRSPAQVADAFDPALKREVQEVIQELKQLASQTKKPSDQSGRTLAPCGAPSPTSQALCPYS